MNNRPTRSNTDFTDMNIENLGLPVKNEKQKGDSATTDEETNINLDETTTTNKVNSDAGEKSTELVGHDLNDQPVGYTSKQNLITADIQSNTIQKFNGQINIEQWLKQILEKFDSIQLSPNERKNLIPDMLTGEALIWYFKEQSYMPTFNSFIKNVLYQYGKKNVHQERLSPPTIHTNQMKQEPINDCKETVMESLRNQMLINSLEKLQKFSGKSKQNVSKWLRETQQAMHILQLTDDEKLFFISTCLEADAREWFFDNAHLLPTWTIFIQKLIRTFESSGKADISFNRLRHYQQGLNQDVRQYYFEIMKLCKEANPSMDDSTKLQYLKDSLKPSLRFDVLLRNPQSTEEVLEYAQKVEELKSLDEKDDINERHGSRKSPDSLTLNSKSKNMDSLENYQQTKGEQTDFLIS